MPKLAIPAASAIDPLVEIIKRTNLKVRVCLMPGWPWPASAQRVFELVVIAVSPDLTKDERVRAIKVLGTSLLDSPLLDTRTHGCAYLFEIDGTPEVVCASHLFDIDGAPPEVDRGSH